MPNVTKAPEFQTKKYSEILETANQFPKVYVS